MADEIITTTETSAIIPEIWSAKFYEVLDARLPFIESVDKNYEGEIQNLGDIVNISTVGNFSVATDLLEGQMADAEATSVTGQQLTINKRTFKDFIVTKKSQLQSLSHMDQLRDRAVYAIMKKMHADIIAATVPSASSPDHQIAFDSGSTLALADILEAKELLDTQDVPQEMRKMLVGAAQWNDLYNISQFTSKDFVPAGSPVSSGAFQTQLVGFTVDWSSLIGNAAYLFHPSYLTMAMQQQLNVDVFKLEGRRASRVEVDILWGLKQLDNTRVVKIG